MCAVSAINSESKDFPLRFAYSLICKLERPESSAFHYYECCGTLYNECCFRLQTWLIIVLAVIGVLIIASIVISLVKCIFCCN
ncbi:unnamed protein product [Dracunculus medinensis]|uniref:CX domain-containing protein n=1 Tax=Dracunculus medinensis TaxID=318479 RepID=A0A0N4U508_DRAME|nr:unnamed protein product [Dracunculus medinensis]